MSVLPFFSVIVPVYNVEQFLRGAVESVIDQDRNDVEIILVDDGSTDRSSEICDELAELSQSVFVVHQQNKGLSGARNTGIESAQGRYIVFLDSDDSLPERSLAVLRERTTDEPDVVAFDGTRIFSMHDETVRSPSSPVCSHAVLTGPAFLRLELQAGQPTMMAPLYAYRREFLDQKGLRFTEGILHEDEDWTPRVLVVAHSVVPCSASLYLYRVRAGSITRTDDRTKNAEDIFRIVSGLRRMYDTCNADLRCSGRAYLARVQMNAMTFSSREQLRALSAADRRTIRRDARGVSFRCKALFLTAFPTWSSVFLNRAYRAKRRLGSMRVPR